MTLFRALRFVGLSVSLAVMSAAASAQSATPPSASWWPDVLKGLASGMGAAIVALFGAWFVTLRLTTQWDARKKRAELDMALAKDFYRLVGSFKALAREGAALGARPQQAPEEWEKWHTDLVRRAIAAEFDMEAALIAIVSEDTGEDASNPDLRRRQLHAAGLLRVAYRNLREQIERGRIVQPGFNSPLFWLMNRIQGELSQLVFARAVREIRRATSGAPSPSAASYLSLIAYRTADLETAAGRLAPHVADFLQRRARSRDQQREKNVQALFRTGGFVLVSEIGELRAPLPAGTTVAVVLSNKKTFVGGLDIGTEAVLQSNPSLNHVLFIGDHLDTAQPPGSEHSEVHAVYVRPRGQQGRLCGPAEELPPDLPCQPAAELRRAGITLPARGFHLLSWSLDAEARKALRRIAESNI